MGPDRGKQSPDLRGMLWVTLGSDIQLSDSPDIPGSHLERFKFGFATIVVGRGPGTATSDSSRAVQMSAEGQVHQRTLMAFPFLSVPNTAFRILTVAITLKGSLNSLLPSASLLEAET